MTQEDKELLLIDLCARLPYGVKVYAGEDLAMALKQIDYECFCEAWENEDFKCHSRWMLPYLRPMSSMTEEEKVQLSQYACIGEDLNGEFIDEVQRKDCAAYIDWLNKNHFDYRGLIEKGLAIEAPEDMYKI